MSRLLISNKGEAWGVMFLFLLSLASEGIQNVVLCLHKELEHYKMSMCQCVREKKNNPILSGRTMALFFVMCLKLYLLKTTSGTRTASDIVIKVAL